MDTNRLRLFFLLAHQELRTVLRVINPMLWILVGLISVASAALLLLEPIPASTQTVPSQAPLTQSASIQPLKIGHVGEAISGEIAFNRIEEGREALQSGKIDLLWSGPTSEGSRLLHYRSSEKLAQFSKNLALKDAGGYPIVVEQVMPLRNPAQSGMEVNAIWSGLLLPCLIPLSLSVILIFQDRKDGRLGELAVLAGSGRTVLSAKVTGIWMATSLLTILGVALLVEFCCLILWSMGHTDPLAYQQLMQALPQELTGAMGSQALGDLFIYQLVLPTLYRVAIPSLVLFLLISTLASVLALKVRNLYTLQVLAFPAMLCGVFITGLMATELPSDSIWNALPILNVGSTIIHGPEATWITWLSLSLCLMIATWITHISGNQLIDRRVRI